MEAVYDKEIMDVCGGLGLMISWEFRYNNIFLFLHVFFFALFIKVDMSLVKVVITVEKKFCIFLALSKKSLERFLMILMPMIKIIYDRLLRRIKLRNKIY